MIQPKKTSSESTMPSVQPFQLKFNNINVVATVDQKVEVAPGKFQKQKVKKILLNKINGIFAPNTFSAIVGPSGCGKTTMLNLLSGRLLSDNLQLDGQLFVNGIQIDDINKYETIIGYIMQEDLLMPTFTPRQSFRFVADLRLPGASDQEKSHRVQELISILGLTKCSNTKIGDAIIRGVSGGEKRRCSIGVQLLTNPSIIFLDEPTTGLDSTTSLHLMQFLNKIAKAGRTIISTIHQPSSQIFNQFDRLLIMVQGNIVYQGQAKQSMQYFGRIGFPIKRNSNPTDYYMRIMNKQGLSLEYLQKGQQINDNQIKKQFEQRVTYFKEQYSIHPHNFQSTTRAKITKFSGHGNLNFLGQVYYITKRALIDMIRNPLDLLLKIFQMVIQGAFCAILYYKQADNGFSSIQNVTGCLSFFVTAAAFAGIVGSVSTFSCERSIFIRQRMSNTYSTIAYFVARNMAYIPMQLFLPLIFLVIGYFSSHLDNSAGVFFLQLLVLQLVWWMSSSFGFLISTIIKQFDVAISLIPVLIIPFMLVSGFFVSLDQVPKFFYWLEYLSMFKYGYQAMVTNQYRNPTDCGDGVYCDILATKFKFPDANWLNFFLMAIIGFAFRMISYIALEWISNPKKMKLGQNKGRIQQRYPQMPISVPMTQGSAQVLNQGINNISYNYQNPNYPGYSFPSLTNATSSLNQIAVYDQRQIGTPRIKGTGNLSSQYAYYNTQTNVTNQSVQQQIYQTQSNLKLNQNRSNLGNKNMHQAYSAGITQTYLKPRRF